MPTIEAPTDAIIKVTAGCICGSDLWPYRGENDITPGDTIGHEMIGVVEEVGSEVTSFRPGDFVIVPFCHSDNTCPNCLAGVTSACVNFGITTGGQGEYAKVTQAEGSLVLGASRDDGMPDPDMLPGAARPLGRAADRLALRCRRRACSRGTPPWSWATEPSGCAPSSRRSRWVPSRSSRCRGMPTARSWPASSAPPTSSRSAARREPPGSRSSPPVSARMPCSSASAPTARCGRRSHAARPGSTVGFVGVPHGVELPVSRMFGKNIGLAGGIAPVRTYLPTLLELVTSGAIDPGPVFDMRLPLDEVAEGYRRWTSGAPSRSTWMSDA